MKLLIIVVASVVVFGCGGFGGQDACVPLVYEGFVSPVDRWQQENVAFPEYGDPTGIYAPCPRDNPPLVSE